MNTGNDPQQKNGKLSSLSFLVIFITLLLISACAPTSDKTEPGSPPMSQDASDRDAFAVSIRGYEKLLKHKTTHRDRVLFEMGIAYSHPKNTLKNYEKAIDCFQKIVDDFPKSNYRSNSRMMIFQIRNVLAKDELLSRQMEQINIYRRQIQTQAGQITSLHEEIDSLRKNIFRYSKIPIDKILIEKQKRQLTLVSKGLMIKAYHVALGKNPVGPKERQGDSKTPEGWYFIESRNRFSKYHLALRLSYPNEKDTKRSKALGVAPGGGIMIHGLKNGHADIGAFHATMDWTDGCIAVTNKEIEEIAQAVPDGTPVEIRP